MIGVIGNSRRDGKTSFEALVKYCEKDEQGKSRAEYTGMQNIHFPESAASEMASLAFMNPRCKDPLMHIILSWREMELPTNKQVDEAVKIALKELDLQECQAIWILHTDTQNRHVHIAVNRIHPETYRAVQPAGRWTHRAIQRASRKIEAAQSWEPEIHGIYSVSPEGVITEREDQETENPKLSKDALDLEAHTAQKSAERVCQETAAPIIRETRSWEELHQRLAEQGISFERKGSGAILSVNGVIVKASKAGRDISLSKLETRLGAYKPREAGVIVGTRPKEAVERVKASGVKSNWERYTEEREKYYKEKKEAADTLAAKQKEERAELSRKQKEEREGLFSRSWKGMGAALNRQRSVMAATQKGKMLNLKDRQQKEHEELKKRFPSRFPNFKTWLETTGENSEPFLSFRYPDAGTIRGAGEINDAIPTPDIRAFTPTVWNKGGVAYRAQGESEAKFIDYGKKIVMAEKCGDMAILAALQLANQKWCGAVVNGSDEYKNKCVELAVRYNLTLSNPDLAALVEEAKKNRKERQTMSQREGQGEKYMKFAIEQYTEAVGAERYRITVTEFTEGGTKAFIHDKRNGGYEGKKKEEILDAIPKFSAYSSYGKNIIVTPMSKDRHHILVDDLTPEKLKQLEGDGYRPACVIESSPNNFQAIITVPSIEGDSSKDRDAANSLTKELNIIYGDPKLSGSVHGHRLPPFQNKKPKHRREDGTYPDTRLIEANGGFCGKARTQLEAIHFFLKGAEERAKGAAETPKRASADSFTGAGDPTGAYWIHYRDIASKFKGTMDYSRIDAMIGTRMRVTGYTQSEVAGAIENNAPAIRRETMSGDEFTAKYKNRDWSRYASETAENFVFGPRGAVQFQRALDFRPFYMRMEGRDAFAEARAERERREKTRAESKKSAGR